MSSIGPKQMCLTCKKYKSTTSFFCGLVDNEEDFLDLIKDKKLECELENKDIDNDLPKCLKTTGGNQE